MLRLPLLPHPPPVPVPARPAREKHPVSLVDDVAPHLLKVGAMKPLSTGHGSLATARHSSFSCGSNRTLMVSRWAESETTIVWRCEQSAARLAAPAFSIADAERLAEVGADDDAGFDRTLHHPPVFDRRGRHVRAPAGIERVSHAAGDAQVALGIELALVSPVCSQPSSVSASAVGLNFF